MGVVHSARVDPEQPRASVVIATRNRRAEVLRTVHSCLRQTFQPLEVLVYDDASEDGTTAAVQREFPSVRVVHCEQHQGYIALRNRGFHEARGEYTFSLDDDSYFTCPHTVARVVQLFDEHPQAAAIALPYVEPNRHDRSKKMNAAPQDRRLRSYVGCAHALRRDVALQLGGYREFLIHQGEERDLSIRLLDRGYEVRYADTQPLIHEYSNQRSLPRLEHFGVRNTLLFDMLNVPFPYVVPRMLADAAQLFFYKLSPWTIHKRAWYVVFGLAACVRHVGHRSAVSRATYVRYRSLPGHGPLLHSTDVPLQTASAPPAPESGDSRFDLPCVGVPS